MANSSSPSSGPVSAVQDPEGYVHSFETLGALDGPGLRLVVFLQGCPLRCRYCHNPDTWPMAVAGSRVTVANIVRRAERLRPYFGQSGGVTLSGGEPLAQPGFILAVLKALHTVGIQTALDTSGWFPPLAARPLTARQTGDLPGSEPVEAAAPALAMLTAILMNTDLVLLDIKHPDPDHFRWLTGQPIEPLLTFLGLCSQLGKSVWLRQVIVPSWNDQKDQLDQLVRLVRSFGGLAICQWQLLAYHTLALGKYETLGLAYPLTGVPALSAGQLADLQAALNERLRA